MKVSRTTYNIVTRLGLMLIAAFILLGIAKPEWLQSLALSKKTTFYTLGIIFLSYTFALFYSVIFSKHKQDMQTSAKLMQLIRAPLYLCISGFCFYYSWAYL